jgi:hypothetical protein
MHGRTRRKATDIQNTTNLSVSKLPRFGDGINHKLSSFGDSINPNYPIP